MPIEFPWEVRQALKEYSPPSGKKRVAKTAWHGKKKKPKGVAYGYATRAARAKNVARQSTKFRKKGHTRRQRASWFGQRAPATRQERKGARPRNMAEASAIAEREASAFGAWYPGWGNQPNVVPRGTRPILGIVPTAYGQVGMGQYPGYGAEGYVAPQPINWGAYYDQLSQDYMGGGVEYYPITTRGGIGADMDRLRALWDASHQPMPTYDPYTPYYTPPTGGGGGGGGGGTRPSTPTAARGAGYRPYTRAGDWYQAMINWRI